MRYIFILLSLLFLLPTQSVSALSVSDSSATLVLNNKQYGVDQREQKMEILLRRYNSVLVPHSRLILETSDKYNLPWSLLTAIAGVESGFCKATIPDSYNCWGFGNGRYVFVNYESAINHISKTIKDKYFDRGLISPELMGPVYAPPSKTWSRKVRYYMNLLENMPSENNPLQIDL